MALHIRFWGVRGSVPSPGPATAGVGGNTSCVEVRCGDHLVILDAGTGMRRLGDSLLAERPGQPIEASVLFSHVHWDHIQGFPFFAPVFRSDTTLHLYGRPDEGTLEEVLSTQMNGPTFPVALGALPSALSFNTWSDGAAFEVGPFQVRTSRLHHPGACYAYRLEAHGRSIVYATDTEHYEDDRLDAGLVELARGADVLIYDAMYTPEEYEGVGGICRRGWGHSTWVEGVRVARAAGVGQLVLFHHDPTHDDETVAAIERAAARELPSTVAAREGLEIKLACPSEQRAA